MMGSTATRWLQQTNSGTHLVSSAGRLSSEALERATASLDIGNIPLRQATRVRKPTFVEAILVKRGLVEACPSQIASQETNAEQAGG